MFAGGVVTAGDTLPGQVVTGLGVAITITLPTLGESPVACLTLRAVPRAHIVNTQALSTLGITKIVPRSILMAVTGCKTQRKHCH